MGVQPCQWACNKGAYTWSQEPGLLTMIIAITVAPRNTSIDSNREVDIPESKDSQTLVLDDFRISLVTHRAGHTFVDFKPVDRIHPRTRCTVCTDHRMIDFIPIGLQS